MGNITINIWMILAVILSAGMVAILMFSIYRGFFRCHDRIDKQNNSLEKIDGRLDNINNEITNIKIDQATMKAVQTFRSEDSKAQPSAVPIHIYGQQSPQQSLQPTAQPVAQPLEYSYEPRLQQTRHEEPRRVQQTSHESGRKQEPIYHKTRRPTISLTEFQLPEECDFEDEVYSQSRPEAVAQPIQQTGPELVPQQRPQQSPQLSPEMVPQQSPQPSPEIMPQQIFEQGLQPRPTSIPPKERLTPSKFNSLNDGISRTGRRYSEEELAHRILD